MISLKWVGALIRYLQSVFQIISVICNVANSCESSCFFLMILYNIDMMWWLWVLFPRKLRDGSEIKLLKTIVLEESRGFHRMAMSSNVVMIWWMVTKGVAVVVAIIRVSASKSHKLLYMIDFITLLVYWQKKFDYLSSMISGPPIVNFRISYMYSLIGGPDATRCKWFAFWFLPFVYLKMFWRCFEWLVLPFLS